MRENNRNVGDRQRVAEASAEAQHRSLQKYVYPQLVEFQGDRYMFLAGFHHINHLDQIDYKSVRLCFQVFVDGTDGNKLALDPVVSDPIHDQKAVRELCIVRLCHPCACVTGGESVTLLCKKVVLTVASDKTIV